MRGLSSGLPTITAAPLSPPWSTPSREVKRSPPLGAFASPWQDQHLSTRRGRTSVSKKAAAAGEGSSASADGSACPPDRLPRRAGKTRSDDGDRRANLLSRDVLGERGDDASSGRRVRISPASAGVESLIVEVMGILNTFPSVAHKPVHDLWRQGTDSGYRPRSRRRGALADPMTLNRDKQEPLTPGRTVAVDWRKGAYHSSRWL